MGSLPLTYIIGQLKGVNLKKSGTKNVGGANLFQTVSRRWGVIAAIADAFKGIVIIFVARGLNFEPDIVVASGVVVIVGQCFPIFLKFSGGRGNSVALGVAVVLAPLELFLSLISPAIGFVAGGTPNLLNRSLPLKERLKFNMPHQSKGIPFGMLVLFFVLPLLSWWDFGRGGQPVGIILAFSVIFILIVLRRLTAGLREDLKKFPDKKKLLLYRFLFDRSPSQ
jgi:hypothetical protein